jgi:hypothetical protein
MRPRSLLLPVPKKIAGGGEAPEPYFPKAHLDFFVKGLITEDATTEHYAYNHAPCLPSHLFLEKTGVAWQFSAHLIFNHVYTLRTILAGSNENFDESYKLVTNLISQPKYIGSRDGFRSAP